MAIHLASRAILDLLNSQLQLSALLPALIDVVLQLTSAERGFVMLPDSEEGFEIASARDSQMRDLPAQEFTGSSSIVKKAMTDRKSIYIPSLPLDGSFANAPSIRASRLYSVFCIPLVAHEKVVGVLYLDSVRPLHAQMEESEFLRLMEGLANHVAIAIQNAKLFEDLKKKSQEIQSLNQQLQTHLDLQTGKLNSIESLYQDSQRQVGKQFRARNLVAGSEAMQKVFRIVDKVAQTSATVLIQGESGTGKELIANSIHYNSSRSDRPLVSINCAAFSETLLESELFGHRKGSFTGADHHKPGLFQIADKGTLFLDEIGDMSAEMQKKILRVLQNGEIRPLGGSDVYAVDVRIIAASNKNLRNLVDEQKFREDLYYRLHVIEIQLPPLRDRKEDIPLLVQHFARRISDELQRNVPDVPASLIGDFREYDWPGNVRELENELRRFFILESEYVFVRAKSSGIDSGGNDMNLAAQEKRMITKALEAAGGNKTRASELLGIPLRTLYDKLKKFEIIA